MPCPQPPQHHLSHSESLVIYATSLHHHTTPPSAINLTSPKISKPRFNSADFEETKSLPTAAIMAEAASPEHKPRKSVSFDPESTVVDEFGDVTTEANGHSEKVSAESHSTENGDKGVDDAADMFKDMKLKKKKKSKTPKEGDEAVEAVTADGEFDPSALKKKKKKKTKPTDSDDFEAKLAEAGVDKDEGDADADDKDGAVIDDDGDMDAGTGIWAHDEKRPLSYQMLLDRIYIKLLEKNPDAAAGAGGKSIKIPPPQCLREGNKKTIFANISEIARRLKRTDEHVTQYLFAELGTSGSVDGSRRLVIKGRFQAKQLEQVLRNYIRTTCSTTNSEQEC